MTTHPSQCLLACADSFKTIGSTTINNSHHQIVQCQGCGLAKVHPQPTIKTLTKYYNKFHAAQSITPNKNKEINRLKKISSFCPEPKSLLDIGAGSGDFLAQAKHQGWQVFGYDLSLTAAKNIYKTHHISIKSGHFTASLWPKNTFDVITLHSTIEHTQNPLKVLKTLLPWLKPQGLLVISVPNIFSFEWYLYSILRLPFPGFIPEHLWYFTPTSFKKFLSLFDLKILQLTSQHYSPPEKLRKHPLKLVTLLAKYFLEHTALGARLCFGNNLYTYAIKP